MRERLRRLREPSAWPGWILWIAWGVEKAGDAEWIASKAQSIPVSVVLDFMGEWGWLFGVAWIAYIVMFGPRLPFKTRIRQEEPTRGNDDEVGAPADEQPAESQPLLTWAAALLDSERELPVRYLKYRARITNAAHLGDDNPFFDLLISVEYGGVLQVSIGDRYAEGRLQWNGSAFAERPDFEARPPQPFPLNFKGPATGGVFRIRQYVRDSAAVTIKEFFDRKPYEIEFTHDLRVSLVMEAFDGEVIFDGDFPFGEYITIPLNNVWSE